MNKCTKNIVISSDSMMYVLARFVSSLSAWLTIKGEPVFNTTDSLSVQQAQSRVDKGDWVHNNKQYCQFHLHLNIACCVKACTTIIYLHVKSLNSCILVVNFFPVSYLCDHLSKEIQLYTLSRNTWCSNRKEICSSIVTTVLLPKHATSQAYTVKHCSTITE